MARRAALLSIISVLACVGMVLPGSAGAAPEAATSVRVDPEPPQVADPEPWQQTGDAAPGAYSDRPQPVVQPLAQAQRRSAGDVRTASVVTESAWSWYMDPRVLGTSRATYLSSVRKNGDVQLTKVTRGSSVLDHTVLHPSFQADDHNAPSLTELPDGRIAAFWTGHSTVPPRYRVTSKPGDISTFGPSQKLTGSGLEGEKATYTTMLQLRGNAYRYHLFTRRARDNAWVLTRSKDLKTWTPAIRLFAHPTRSNVPYPKFVTTGWNSIHMAVSDTTASPTQHSSMFHLTLTNGTFRRSDGTTIRSLSEVAGGSGRAPRPIDPREATLVYDGRSADGRARIYDIALRGNEPTLVLTTGDRPTDTWTYKWFRLRGRAWTAKTLDRSPGPQPSGITLRHDDPGRVFLSRGPGGVGSREIVEMTSGDHGDTWRSRKVTHGSTQGNRTPATPWGAQDGPLSVAWLKGPYEAFNGGRWDTIVTMETTDPAPLNLRTTWPSGWSRGKGISARVTAGVGGPGVAGRRVWLMVRKPGQAETAMRSVLTGAAGSAHLPVNRYYPKGTRVRVEVPAAGEWGRARTHSVSTSTDTSAIRLDSTWRSGWDDGVGVSASVSAVRDGAPVVGARVYLLVRKPGEKERWMHSARTDSGGSVHLAVNRYYPKGTRVRLHVPASGDRGAATSPAHLSS
ncbi:MAG TPA: BNR repeat-containing protein [Candidatus Janibacter merdipullorum]|nr:BNR repeat-containing protein [Candidatus Janibacter merdipullorum]